MTIGEVDDPALEAAGRTVQVTAKKLWWPSYKVCQPYTILAFVLLASPDRVVEASRLCRFVGS